jgi:hypothetical protein
MKKIVIAFGVCCLSYPMFAQQLPFLSYTPVYADPVQVTPPPSRNYDPMDPLGFGDGGVRFQQKDNYQTINAYIIRNNKFQKIKIKVFSRGRNIYINSYYDKEKNMWYDGFNTNASPTQKNDGDVIYNNFDLKAYISPIGYVYF